jgi:flagellar hook assembly protein FlgD
VDDGSLSEQPNVEVTLGVYPNPFSEYTNFTFSLDESTDVRLVIYDLSGKVIKTLADREFEQGTNQVQWNGTNDAGAPVAVGVYFYRMEAGEFVKTDRVVVTK